MATAVVTIADSRSGTLVTQTVLLVRTDPWSDLNHYLLPLLRRVIAASHPNTIIATVKPVVLDLLSSEMVDLYPTLVELAGLPVVPKCTGDPDPSVHCLMGVSVSCATEWCCQVCVVVCLTDGAGWCDPD